MYIHPLSNKHIVYIYKRACLVYTYMFGMHMSYAYIYVHIYVCVYTKVLNIGGLQMHVNVLVYGLCKFVSLMEAFL